LVKQWHTLKIKLNSGFDERNRKIKNYVINHSLHEIFSKLNYEENLRNLVNKQ